MRLLSEILFISDNHRPDLEKPQITLMLPSVAQLVAVG